MENKPLSLADLEAATGITARTIRHYIGKNLVPPPSTVGRNASYGPEHLDVLYKITSLKKQGLSLEQIRLQLAGVDAPAVTMDLWYQVHAAPDVVVLVKADIVPWRRNHIDRALVTFVQAVATPHEDPDLESEEK